MVYAATVNNSVHAFDAERQRVAGAYWQVPLNPSGTRPHPMPPVTAIQRGPIRRKTGNPPMGSITIG
jgi:hypothetical protein